MRIVWIRVGVLPPALLLLVAEAVVIRRRCRCPYLTRNSALMEKTMTMTDELIWWMWVAWIQTMTMRLIIRRRLPCPIRRTVPQRTIISLISLAPRGKERKRWIFILIMLKRIH